MDFLGKELDGALTSQKIRGLTSHTPTFLPTTDTLHVQFKGRKASRKVKMSMEPFCVFCEFHGHWAWDCKTVTDMNDKN
jgi:hypothetical protein